MAATRGMVVEMGAVAESMAVDPRANSLAPNERVSNGQGTPYPAGH